jgi:hypothetical protein
MGREQIAVKTALASPVTLEKVWAFEGTRPQRITEYHIFRRFAGRKDSCVVSQKRSFQRGTAWFLNQSASSTSLRLPSARWRKVK